MQACINAGHLVEFREEKDGIIVYHCVPCDVEHLQFQDCCAGR